MHQAQAGGCAGVVLDLVTEALDAIAVGQDPRPVVCCALADAVGADAAGFLSPRLHVVVRPDPAQPVADHLLHSTHADRRVARLPGSLRLRPRRTGSRPTTSRCCAAPRAPPVRSSGPTGVPHPRLPHPSRSLPRSR